MHGFVYVLPIWWPVVGSSVGWMDGLILYLGLGGQQLRINTCWMVFPLHTLWLLGGGVCDHV